MSELKWFLKVLFTPACWVQNYPYSKDWDEKLKRLLEERRFVNVTYYTAEISGHVVWIANHPYASFSLYREPLVRPSRRTILKAMEKLVLTRLSNSQPT